MKQIITFLEQLLIALHSGLQKTQELKEKKQNKQSLKVHQNIEIRNNKHKTISKKQLRAHCHNKLLKRRQQHLGNMINEINKNGYIRQNAYLNKCLIKKKFNEYIMEGSNEDLLCSICKNQFFTPAITECNHIFCLQCIQKSLKYSIKCPLCRHQVSNSDHHGLNLFQSIQKLSKKISQYKNKDIHQKKLQIHNQWKENRFIKEQDMKQKVMIDVWDLNSHKWKRAEIVNIYDDEQPRSMMIEYTHGDKQKQIIQLPSLRISTYKFYSLDEPNHQDRFGFNFFLLSSSAMRPTYHSQRAALRSANENLIQVYTRLRQDRQRDRRLRRQQRNRQRQTRQRQRVLRRREIERTQNWEWLIQPRPRNQLMLQQQHQLMLQQQQSLSNPFSIAQGIEPLSHQPIQIQEEAQQFMPQHLSIQNIQSFNEIQQIIDIPNNNLENLRPNNNIQSPISIESELIQQNLPNLNPNNEIVEFFQPEIYNYFSDDSDDIILYRGL